MKHKIPTVDKYLSPLNTPGNQSPQQKYIPWSWGVRQGVQLKKIRSSTGYFKKLSAGAIGSVTSITGGTINTSSVNASTITNSNFQGMLSQSVSTGGTFTNPTITTGTLNTSLMSNGTLNNGVLGTPAITGGTYNSINLGGTAIYPVTAGTQSLTVNNMFQLQTLSGSVILVVRSSNTNFYFTCAGTF